MIIELLLRTNDNPMTTHRNRWDVIVAGLSAADGGVWGRLEVRHFQIIEIDTTDLAAFPLDVQQKFQSIAVELTVRQATERNPKVVTPFRTEARQSSVFFDLDRLPHDELARVKDRNHAEPKKPHARVKSLLVRRNDPTPGEEQQIQRQRDAINAAKQNGPVGIELAEQIARGVN